MCRLWVRVCVKECIDKFLRSIYNKKSTRTEGRLGNYIRLTFSKKPFLTIGLQRKWNSVLVKLRIKGRILSVSR